MSVEFCLAHTSTTLKSEPQTLQSQISDHENFTFSCCTKLDSCFVHWHPFLNSFCQISMLTLRFPGKKLSIFSCSFMSFTRFSFSFVPTTSIRGRCHHELRFISFFIRKGSLRLIEKSPLQGGKALKTPGTKRRGTFLRQPLRATHQPIGSLLFLLVLIYQERLGNFGRGLRR